MVDELTAEGQRLDGLTVDDSAAVNAAISWSYRDLSAEAAHMFRVIGLHRGAHVSIGAAAALAGDSVLAARPLLDRLTSLHLLEGLGGDRYQMHDLLRTYAAEQAVAEDAEADRTLASRRMVDWYLRNAYAANHVLEPHRNDPVLDPPELGVDIADFDYDRALEWCEIETPNIVMAGQRAVELGENVTAWKLAAGSFNYLYLRKRWSLWMAMHEKGIVGARRAGDRYGEAWVLNNLAIAYRELRVNDQARTYFRQALDIRRELGDHVGEAWTLTGIGFIDLEENNFDDATTNFANALNIFRVSDEPIGECVALAKAGDAYRGLHDFDRALESFHQALELFGVIDDHHGEGLTLVLLGDTYWELGRPDDSLQCFQRALDRRLEIGDRLRES